MISQNINQVFNARKFIKDLIDLRPSVTDIAKTNKQIVIRVKGNLIKALRECFKAP